MKKTIDISTEEKKKEVFDILNGFKSKNQAHIYFGISDNADGSKYLAEIADNVGFNLSIYKERQKRKVRYCKQCGKEILNKWAKNFCSSSCAATYNNKQRDKSVYEKLGDKLRIHEKKEHTKRKPKEEKYCIICGNKIENKSKKFCSKECRTIFLKKKNKKQCEYCGKTIDTSTRNVRFCSNQCCSKFTHEQCYKDFLENNEKYCNGGYTPKAFKNDFLKEQDNKCAICGCEPFHNGKPLVFIIDHIDGDASNNKRENLRMVCPNCDSQLDTFKSKNKHSARRNYWRERLFKTLT